MFEGVEDLEGFKNAMEGKGMMGGEGKDWGENTGEKMDPEMMERFENIKTDMENLF